MIALLACSVLLVAPPELDTAASCISAVSCAPTQHDQQARFYLRAEAIDTTFNVSDFSVLAAQVEFDVADVACWRRLLAGKPCPIPPVEMSGPLGVTVREELAGLAPGQGDRSTAPPKQPSD